MGAGALSGKKISERSAATKRAFRFFLSLSFLSLSLALTLLALFFFWERAKRNDVKQRELVPPFSSSSRRPSTRAHEVRLVLL